MKKHQSGQSISALAALVLLAVFAVGLLSVLLSGAGAYRRLSERDRNSYDSRTCIQYVAAKVRQAPAPGSVSLSKFGAGDCLILSEQVDGWEYLTRIYCYEGWLMELFAASGDDFAPEDGERLMPLNRFSLVLEGSLLQVNTVDTQGFEHRLLLSLRGGGGAVS